ncbi:Histone acetyltransferase protein [Dioscorea alata]|uniref:Histone acetyltransferase protein n=4 Tax=Dioscorea alata TaxID=55571 RepID=A0ACB7VM33_DIOAL|nr:Histone acetyltransferase protein [Dioscorea alata]
MEKEGKSVEVKENGVAKKRVCSAGAVPRSSSGGGNVCELKGGEKKRRLILSDSEDSDEFLISPRSKFASGDFQNGSMSVTGKKDSMQRLKRGEVKRVVVSDAGRRIEAEADCRDNVELGLKRKRCGEGSYDEVRSKKCMKRITEGNGVEKMITGSVKHTDNLSKINCKPLVPPDKESNGLNDQGMQCEPFNNSESSKIEASDELNGGGKSTVESKELDSNLYDKPEVADGQKNELDDRRIEAKMAYECGSSEAVDGLRDGTEERKNEAEKLDLKESSKLEAADRQSDDPGDNRITAKMVDSDVPNKLETADSPRDNAEVGNIESEYLIPNKSHKTESADKESEVIIDGSGEAIKTDLNMSGNLQKNSPLSGRSEAEKPVLLGSSKSKAAKLDKSVDKSTEAKKSGSTKSSKLETADRRRNAFMKGKVGSLVSDSKDFSKLEAEKTRSIQHSSQRTLKTGKGDTTYPICVKRKDHSIVKDKNVKRQGNFNVWKSLRGKKSGGPGKGLIVREKEEEARNSLCSSSIAKQNKILKQPSVSGERKILIRSTSSRNQSATRKNSSVQKCRSYDAKADRLILSSKRNLKGLGSPDVKEHMTSKVEGRASSKAPLLDNQNAEAPSAGRGTARQKLREQIKGILLDAGWKIDLRPRRGRNYEDNVYISPEGRGYWSITKAYAMFQEKLPSGHEAKQKGLPIKLLKKSGGSDHNLEGPSSPISMNMLSILKRKTAKQRSREELEETPLKISDHKRRIKEKQTTDDIGRKKKLKSSNISSTTNSVALAAQKPPILERNNSNKRGCALLVRGAHQEAESDDDDYVPYVWKRTVLSWLIDLGILPINGIVKYMNKRRTRAILEGRITRDGIHCNCCSKILSVSKFELHAGSKLQQPYENIYVDKLEMSLLQCLLDAWGKQESSERQGFFSVDVGGDDPNDDTCGICGDGGDLICCDGCPSTFHLNCLGIKVPPPGDWHCSNCSCKFCWVASGSCPRGSGQTAQLLCCSLCEEKYHKNCVPEVYALRRVSNNAPTSFCGRSCGEVFKGLHKLIGAKNDLEAGFSWSVLCRFDEDSPKHHFELPRKAECNSKIAVALAVMDECFLPITDERSGINLIHNVVYNCGSNFSRLNYSGFYTFVLERGDEIISVASIRIHGTRLAEMPFIGTRNMYRRQGMCRRLLTGIEAALSSLNIEKLIIPAISELTETWTTVFGFKPLDTSQRQEVRYVNMLVFPGTGLLQKTFFSTNSTEHHTIATEVDKVEHLSKDNCKLDLAKGSPRVSSGDCKSKVDDTEPNVATFGDSGNSPSEVSLLSYNDSHGSQLKAHKFMEKASDTDLSLKTEGVYHDGTVNGNHKVDNAGAGFKLDVHAAAEVAAQHMPNAKFSSSDASGSNLQDCNESNLHVPVSSQVLSTDGAHLDRCEVANLSHSSLHGQQGSKIIPETDFQNLSGMSSMVNEPYASPVDSKSCADKDMKTDANVGKAKLVSESHINHIIAGQDTSEANRGLSVASGKESDVSLGGVASDFDAVTEKPSTFFHAPEASVKTFIQQDPELTKVLECHIPTRYNCNNPDSINILSPPKQNGTSNGVVLQNKAPNGHSSVEQDPDAVSKSFGQNTPGLVGNDNLDLVAKLPSMFVSEVSALGEGVTPDVSSAPDLATSESSAHLATMVHNASDIASDCMVHRETETADEANTDVAVQPNGPNYDFGKREVDTNFSLVKLANECGSSAQSSLGMISAPASDSSEAIIQQHETELPKVVHAPASGVAVPLADGTNNSEMHKVVNRCRQAVCLVDTTESAD